MTDLLNANVPAETATPEAAGLTRRKMFAGAAGICLAGAGLAACGGGSDSADATTAGAAGTGAAADAGGTVVAAAADVPVGTAVSAKVGGQDAILYRADETSGTAFSAVCPHQGGIVAPKGDQLVCPLHQATYEEATGTYVSGPEQAKVGLKKIATLAVDGDNIVTA